jgi:hypothetical protein
MDQVNLGYSTKNIPIPTKKEYLKSLTNSAEKLIKSVRWRTLFYLNPKWKTEQKETFGFPTSKSPPRIPELNEFEDGLLHLIQNVSFRNTTNAFQQKLAQDIKEIQQSDRLLIAADKTTNFYKVETARYEQLLNSNINKDYKKATTTLENNINKGDLKMIWI